MWCHIFIRYGCIYIWQPNVNYVVIATPEGLRFTVTMNTAVISEAPVSGVILAM